MQLPSAQPLSPLFAKLFADYEAQWLGYVRAAAEEDRLSETFERDKPCNKAAAAAFRGELGLDAAITESDRCGDDLARVARKILDAEPAGWPDLVALSGLIRHRNPPDVNGRTAGFYGEIPDFPRHIECFGAALAQAEATDAIVVDMTVRYEAMAAEHDERLEDEPKFVAAYDDLFDAIAAWCPKTLRGLGAMAKTARLRDNDELRERVCAHVETLSGVASGAPSLRTGEPAFSSLESIARDAHALHDRIDRLDESAVKAEQAGRTLTAEAFVEERDLVTDQIRLILNRGLDLPARSLADVLAGLVTIALNVSEFAHNHDDPETEARMEAIEERVQRRLYSLRGFVERLAGVSSDDLCGAYCLSSAFDPFTNGQPFALRLAICAAPAKADAA